MISYIVTALQQIKKHFVDFENTVKFDMLFRDETISTIMGVDPEIKFVSVILWEILHEIG